MSLPRDPLKGPRRAHHDPASSTDSSGSEVTTTERELANDAQWKLIQKNTFTRWANEHLKTVDRNIADLETDLADGLRLIALIEVLAGKKFQKYNKRPAIRTQKLENITMALQFLQIEEKIKLVNIDSSDVVDQQLKLILGLIWTLILHYSISMPVWDEDEVTVEKNKQTPKQRLLAWIQNRVPDRRIVNFTTDWNDGRAIGALVDGVAPGLCPDWEDWNVKDALPNATEAMDAAEKWLDVPQLIKPEEMCNAKVDELSMMTYLSQFPSAKLKTGAPLRPRTNAARVRTYGPGLDASGNSVGAPARFTVETFSAGKGELDVIAINPNGVQMPLESVFNNDQYRTYSCCYMPTMEGPHAVRVRFANREIPKSPFVVNVEGMAGDPSKVTASGPGLEKNGVVVKKKTGFDVFTKNAGIGVVDVVVVDPRGDKNSVRPFVAKVTDDQWYVEYVPQVDGLHSVEIFFAGSHIPSSPVAVLVMPPLDASKCVATGRGIRPTGLRVGDKAQFRVETKNAGPGGQLAVKVTGPNGTEENVNVSTLDQSLYECCYVPLKPGRYSVSVTYGGQPIPKSPFNVQVLPARKCQVRAFGPGLSGGVVDQPARFTVETNGEPGTLGFAIEGPSQSKIECKDNEDGTAEISYVPKTAGEYAIHVLVNNEDINNSPFMANILPASGNFDASKVEVSGNGVEPSGVIVNEQTEFVVDARKAGTAPLEVSLTDVDYNVVNVLTTDNRDGTFTCRYTPSHSVRHTAFISYGVLSVPGSPFRMQVKERSDPGRVKVFGPAFSEKVLTFRPTYFVVDCSEAGPGDISITLADSRNNDVAVKTTDHKDNTFTIQFEPNLVGQYVAHIFFAGKEIPGSPRTISVSPSVDLSGVKVSGVDEKVFTESPVEFSVDLSSVPGDRTGKLKAIITAPSGDKMEAVVIDRPDGSSSCLFSLVEEGLHTVDVFYDGLPCPENPLRIRAVAGCDPSKVKAYGPGLNGGLTFHPQTFTVDTKKAGNGGLGLAIEGPSEAKMTCRDNRDGTCDVEFLPVKRGIYDIAIKFAEQSIPGLHHRPQVAAKTEGIYEVTFDPKGEGQQRIDVLYGAQPVNESPFLLNILPKFEPNRVKVSGDGIQGPVLATVPTSFSIDTTDAGEADVQVLIKDPRGRAISHRVTDQSAGSHRVTYTADSVGRHTVQLLYGGKPVSSTPYSVDVAPAGDANSVKIISDIQSVVPVGKECVVTVDRSSAGVGHVRCHITGDGNDVRTEVKDCGDGTSEISYVLPQKGLYNVQVEYGGQQIPEGFFNQEALDADEYESYLKEQELRSVASTNGVCGNGIDSLDGASVLYNPVDFTIAIGPIFGFVKAEVTTPSGRVDLPKLIDNRNSTVTVRYEPTEIGTHQLDIFYNGVPVDGSPFQFAVDAVRAGSITAYGGGLTQGIVGSKCSFVVDVADLGSNGLVILVEGPSKTDIHVEENNDRTCTVSYTPSLPGDYQICIKYADHDVAGSPFMAKILPPSDDDQQMATLTIGSSRNEISLMAVEPDVENLTSTVRNPSGKESPCALRCLISGHLGISFSAKEVGTHFVNVLRAGSHIKNSPFCINILENQLCRVDKVRAFGKGLAEAKTDEFCEFFINCKDAGFGNLNLSIEGPGRAMIDCQENDVGLCHVRYKPLISGVYAVNIRFADEDINGSPFRVQVKDRSSGQSSERSEAQSHAEITHIGCDFELRLVIRGVLLKDIEASVVNPSFVSEVCQVNELEAGHFAVIFVPQEIGIHKVNVRHCGKDIPGSPFRFTVGPILEGGADRVQVMGIGLEGGKTQHPGHFGIYTKEAGTGNLSVVMEGPSKAVINVKDQMDGSCDVSYLCNQPGDYLLSVKFNGLHVPNSPFRIPVMPSGDADENLLPNDEIIQVNKPTSLLFNMNGDAGHLEALVIDPNGSKEQAFIQQLNNGRYAIRFVPYCNGFHSIHVTRNGKAVYGSPFPLIVGKQEPNPSLVRAHGAGLTKSLTGKQAKFFVNTVEAGPGPLAVSIDGPSKVEVLCNELDKGYELMYTPHAPGIYKISLTYGKEAMHIPNSPFMVLVEGSGRPAAWNERTQMTIESQAKNKKMSSLTNGFGDHEDSGAPLVSSLGPGLQKGLVHQTSNFAVDTSQAGQGIILVGVLGPSGPCEEVTIRHVGSGHYAVSYQPKERGNYLVVIRWGNQHVPGSPFEVLIQ